MDFKLSDEQTMLLDSAKRFVDGEYSFESRRGRLASKQTFDRARWRAIADLGWFAIQLPEELGGLGGSAVDTALIAETVGLGQVIDPYTMCGVFPAAILAGCQDHDRLAALLSGERVFAVAHAEPQARGDLASVMTKAEKAPGGWVLSGRKSLVVGGDAADEIIVSACVDGGVGLFVVASGASGIEAKGSQLADGTSGLDLEFDNVQVGANAVLAGPDRAVAVLGEAVNQAIVALLAEAVGAMEGAIDITAPYLRERRQFGVNLSSFQALQHKMSDMKMEQTMARSALYQGLGVLALEAEPARSSRISGLKAMVTRLGLNTTAQAIQLHGGYGITEEYKVGHYHMRMLVIDALFGGRHTHLARYADWMADTASAAADGS